MKTWLTGGVNLVGKFWCVIGVRSYLNKPVNLPVDSQAESTEDCLQMPGPW